MLRTYILSFILISLAHTAQAFCGFYVAKADGSLYNQSSKVVFVRDGRQSTITMSSDYRGDAKDFAMIIPTPRVLGRSDIRTVKQETLTHLDDYTAPRLVEYHDRDPCAIDEPMVIVEAVEEASGLCLFCSDDAPAPRRGPRSLGVTIKAEYAIGQYDIQILDAKQSDGLSIYLTQEGYQLPDGAEAVLGDYIASGMKFFVARVNLERHAAGATKELPPLQISFKSRNFMLPIQLGKLNADKTQDAIFLMLSRQGRIVPANYETYGLPSDENVPVFVEERFGEFYKALFNRAAPDTGGIVLEYAWDMAWCDPCAADPLSVAELRELGVHWADPGRGNAQDVYVTRLHAQYTKDQMPKDIIFRVTDNRENFQGRYVMNHPWEGAVNCEAGREYVAQTRTRLAKETERLRFLTGWSQRRIREEFRKTTPRRYW